MRRLPSALAAAGALAASLLSPAARASENDGAYGRLDGDVLLIGEAGLAYVDGAAGLALGGRMLYLSTAGFYVRYIDAFEQSGVAAARQMGAGVELRPLFLARFARDWEQGPPRLDLFVDSFAIDVGTFWWSPPHRGIDVLPGLEVAASLEFPFTEIGSGPRLGILGSYRIAQGDAGVRGKPDIDARASFVALQLAWHGILDVGLVDVGDALVRETE